MTDNLVQTLSLSYKTTGGERTNILILAYFRSGSTFLSRMFEANSDVFYAFEPLHFLDKYSKKRSMNLQYLDETIR